MIITLIYFCYFRVGILPYSYFVRADLTKGVNGTDVFSNFSGLEASGCANFLRISACLNF